MRTDTAIVLAFGLVVCGVNAAAPTYSCFDPPDEGQSNPLGEGMEDVVEDECCAALEDDSDVEAGRSVVWDPINCNHGPGETAITEAPLCRAHDTDGCRFCLPSCEGVSGLCVLCDDLLSQTASPTPSPSEFFTEFPVSTEAPFGIFPDTPAPTTPAPTTSAPTTAAPTTEPPASATPAPADSDCQCMENMSETEAEVLVTRGKTMRCDPSCSDGSDLTWGVLNCNYFALGQNCRTCADTCEEMADGTWLDMYEAFCKPCSEIP